MDAAAEALGAAFGAHFEACGEAQFYLALLEVAASAEASLPSVDGQLAQARIKLQLVLLGHACINWSPCQMART